MEAKAKEAFQKRNKGHDRPPHQLDVLANQRGEVFSCLPSVPVHMVCWCLYIVHVHGAAAFRCDSNQNAALRMQQKSLSTEGTSVVLGGEDQDPVELPGHHLRGNPACYYLFLICISIHDIYTYNYNQLHTYTYSTHPHTYIYIYILYVCIHIYLTYLYYIALHYITLH